MEKHILSKSTFIKGHQCLKALYLHKKRPFLRDKMSAEQLAKFKRGHKVGDMAQELFPGGIDVSPKSPSQYQKSVIKTQELIASGQSIIYEATFQFNKVLVMLDILVKSEKGWEAYEVKSSRGLSKAYFTDAALQYYVITQSGLELSSFYLVYVNENYVLESEGEIDIQKYFIKQEVSSEIKKQQSQIAEEVETELLILNGAHSPKIEVGSHCFSPYPCDFQGFCWKGKAQDVFKLPAISNTARSEFINRGILSFKDLKMQDWSNPLIEKQLKSLSTQQAFVSGELKELLSALPKDSLYLGFAARQAAIPQCVGHKPYQNQMISYALISDQTRETFLFSGNCKNYPAFVEHLIQQLISAPQIVVYDKENLLTVLTQSIDFLPHLSSDLEKVNKKIFGINQWILKGQFYFPGLNHELNFKDVVQQVLNSSAFSKQPINSDVLAVNLFEQLLENKTLDNSNSEEAQSLLNYSENIATNCKSISEKLARFSVE